MEAKNNGPKRFLKPPVYAGGFIIDFLPIL
jgi:hypothetical protein